MNKFLQVNWGDVFLMTAMSGSCLAIWNNAFWFTYALGILNILGGMLALYDKILERQLAEVQERLKKIQQEIIASRKDCK